MLVLTRRFGEKIMIGDDITVKFNPPMENSNGFAHGDVRVLIKAPKNIKIMREELITEKDFSDAVFDGKNNK